MAFTPLLRIPTSDLPLEHGKDGCFASYGVLGDLPRTDKASCILRRCAYIVNSIMRRRAWYVSELNELPVHPAWALGQMVPGPKPAGFLGLTRKAALVYCVNTDVKLRRGETPNGFMAISEVMQTILHELAHMYHYGHGLGFYLRNLLLLLELEGHMLQRIVEVGWQEIPRHIVLPGEVHGLKKLFLAPSRLRWASLGVNISLRIY